VDTQATPELSEFPTWLVTGYEQVDNDLESAERLRPSDADLAEEHDYRALSRACELLHRAFALPPFNINLEQRLAYTRAQADVVRAIASSPNDYEHMLDVERQLLMSAGYTDGSAYRIVDTCRQAFERLRREPDLDPAEAQKAFEYITHSTCKAAGDFREAIDEREKRDAANRMSRFTRVAFSTLCGGIVIVINHSTIVANVNIPGISAFSDYLGSSVASEVMATTS
jgi:hypothetical protein